MADDRDIEVTEETEEETSLRDEILSAAGETEEENEIQEETETTQEAQEEVQGEEVPVEDVVEETKLKPPLDWGPEMAAKWGEIDPEIQNAITERERHVEQVLQQSADSRHAVQSFNEMFAPYTPLMQAEGVTDPMRAINGLLQTTATLMMGTPAQKAQKIAGLIQHYGIDIGTLDSVLVGEPGVDPAVNQFNQVLDQRLAPLQQLLDRVNQADQQGAQRTQAEAAQSIEQFAADPKNKYFDHVRLAMADNIDLAAQHGQQITMEQAYRTACMADERIAPLLMQEMAEEAAKGGINAADAASNAASSVSGLPTGGSVSGVDDSMSLREMLESQVAGQGRI